MQKMIASVRKILSRMITAYQVQLQGTYFSVFIFRTIIYALVGGSLSCQLGVLPKWLLFLCGSLFIIVILIALDFIITIIGRTFFHINWMSFWYSIEFIIPVSILLSITSFEQVDYFSCFLLSVVAYLCFTYFLRSLYAMFVHKRSQKFLIILSCFTGIVSLYCIFLVCSDGFLDTYQKNERDIASSTLSEEDYLTVGDFTVSSITYGLRDQFPLKTKKVDLTHFASIDHSVREKYRELVLGYNLDEVPIQGKIWYPKEATNCPTLFIVHGNHLFHTDSYLGYDYIAEYLASHGYVVISVDENMLNSDLFNDVGNENDARAVLMLEHMKFFQKENTVETSPLYQKLDYENIAVAGHSRGGEIVADVYLMNQMTNYPDDASIRFQYNFSIKSLIAISPSYAQYLPAGHEIALKDVNYFVIQGANDQDISTFEGAKQYQDIHFSKTQPYFKSYFYLFGANHGQFNSKWGSYDNISPMKDFFNVKNLIPGEEQQEITKYLIHQFLDATLLRKEESKRVFYTKEDHPRFIQNQYYIQGYEDSSFEIISDFEEDAFVTTCTDQNLSCNGYNFALWKEQSTYYDNGYQRNNHALRLTWEPEKTARYEITGNFQDSKKEFLQFDILYNQKFETLTSPFTAIPMKIELVDVAGTSITIDGSDLPSIMLPLDLYLSKQQKLLEKPTEKKEFSTIRVPLSSFAGNIAQFNERNITKLIFHFDKEQGDIFLDNIGFSTD